VGCRHNILLGKRLKNSLNKSTGPARIIPGVCLAWTLKLDRNKFLGLLLPQATYTRYYK
jgi:hypothetical protein